MQHTHPAATDRGVQELRLQESSYKKAAELVGTKRKHTIR